MGTNLLTEGKSELKQFRHNVRCGLELVWQDQDSLTIGSVGNFTLFIGILGTTAYSELRGVEIKVTLAEDKKCSFRDAWPKKKREMSAQLGVSTPPQISMVPIPTASLNVPLYRDDIDLDLASKSIRWMIRDEHLDENLTAHPRVGFTINFDKDCLLGNVSCDVLVTPSLAKRRGWLPFAVRDIIDDIYEHTILLKLHAKPTKLLEHYDLDPEQGILTKTGIRNVSFRATTLRLLYDHLQDGLSSSYPEVMREAGSAVGNSFIQEYQRRLERLLSVEEWSEYDAAAGMGKLGFEYGSNGKIVRVWLRNSYEAFNKSVGQHHCYWFEGYIEAILSAIVGHDLHVKEIQCASQGHSLCTFMVE